MDGSERQIGQNIAPPASGLNLLQQHDAANTTKGLGDGTNHETQTADPVKNVVLVHGHFADGSGWQDVYKRLISDGYNVKVVQEPETSVEDDVKATKQAIDSMDGPCILVGHSYGGIPITEAGNDDKVKGLVYVAALEPDCNETGEMLNKLVPSVAMKENAIKETADGHLYFDPNKFYDLFCHDIPKDQADFMAISQVLPSKETISVPINHPAWLSKPSWAIIAGADKTINPDLERFMAERAGSTTVEISGSSHVPFISHPKEVTDVIEAATKSV